MFETREDGPNTTAANRTVAFNDQVGSMKYYTEDTTIGGVPSRVIDNVEVVTDEANTAKVPEYTKVGVKAELENMAESGRQQLVVNSPESNLLKQAAVETGAEYSEHNGQAVLKPKAKEPNDQLSDSFSTAKAISAGYTEEDIRGLLSSKGYDEEQAQRIFTNAASIERAQKAGYDDNEIRQFLSSKEVKADTTNSEAIESDQRWPMVKESEAAKAITSSEDMPIEDLVDNLEVLSPVNASYFTRITGYFGDQEAKVKATQAVEASRQRIINLAAERDIELQWHEDTGQFLTRNEQGQLVAVDRNFFSSAQVGSLTGGVGGALGGAYAGALAGSAVGPIGTAAGGVIGSIIGAAAGTFAGSSYDYYDAAIEMQEELEASRMMNHAFNETELAVITDVAFLGAGKAIKFGSGVTAAGFKRAKDLILDGNTKGAYDQLKKIEFLNDSQAEEIVSQLSRVADVPGKNAKEQAIAATAVTKPGAQGLVHAVAASDPAASRAVVKAIDDRAKDLLESTAKLSGDNLSRILREDLSNYAIDVKQFYGSVKAAAAQSPRSNNFRFDYDKLVIDPVVQKLQKNITDPAVLEKFMLQTKRIRDYSDSRSFADLLELRQIVNEFKFNKKITRAKDFDGINSTIKGIDNAIEQGAHFVMENPKKWLNDYGQARMQYAKMKQLERNVMFKSMTREGISADEVTESLAKYIGALDGTFNDLMSSLPKNIKGNVENSVIDTLANRYTAGSTEGRRAVNFPMLADDLNKVTFGTQDARRMKEAINNLAEVFKNDVDLAAITGHVQVDKFQSFLTTDPVARAKYEVASHMFNKIKTLAPGQKSNTLALVNKTAKLLENPLNSRSVKDLMEEAGGKVDISKEVLKLQEETARAVSAGKDMNAGKVKLYGNGNVLKLKGSGAEQTIPVHRIATLDKARKLADQYGINFNDKKLLDQVLKSNGFKALQQGSDSVRTL